jgi:alpha-galactosidase
MTRRELLELAATAPLVVLAGTTTSAQRQNGFDIRGFARASWRAITADGSPAPASIQLSRTWDGASCRMELSNRGTVPVALKGVTVFSLPHDLAPSTPLYGEGFQMLSQTAGSIGAAVDLGNYTDVKHYRMPEPAGVRVVYNLLTLAIPNAHQVLAFTSCTRFSGQFRLLPGVIDVVLDLEDRVLDAGETWHLEEFSFFSGRDRHSLLDDVADRLARNHQPLSFAAPPSGWCSWYCFGPKVTAKQVLDNLDVIARDIPGLRYIQIDDGYQPAMGDWLETGNAFGGEVQTVLKQIRAR